MPDASFAEQFVAVPIARPGRIGLGQTDSLSTPTLATPTRLCLRLPLITGGVEDRTFGNQAGGRAN